MKLRFDTSSRKDCSTGNPAIQVSVKPKLKGQIFIAGAAMFVVLLALIATSIAPAPAMPAAISTAPQLDNLAQEYRYAIGLSAQGGSDRMYELSHYVRDNVQDSDAIYALVSVQPGAYTVTVGNFLRNPADVSITAQGSVPGGASDIINDEDRDSWDFAASGNVNVTIEYTIQNAAYSQSMQFTADKNQTIGWFDIGIRADGNNIRRFGTWNVTT